MNTVLTEIQTTKNLLKSDTGAVQDLTRDADGVVLTMAEIESTIAAAWLSATVSVPLVMAASVHDNDPYNLARRVLSINRSHSNRTALLLDAGELDLLTDSVHDLLDAHGAVPAPAQLWTEYVQLLRDLWRSFPLDAITPDQESGIFAEPGVLKPVNHTSGAYQVAGPLNAPLDENVIPDIYARINAQTTPEEATAFVKHADAVLLEGGASVEQLPDGLRVVLAQRHQRSGVEVFQEASLGTRESPRQFVEINVLYPSSS